MKENADGGINTKDQNFPAANGVIDKEACEPADRKVTYGSGVTKRKVYIVEYESVDHAYTVPIKKRGLVRYDKQSAYIKNQKFFKEEFVKERKRKLAEKDKALRTLSESYFQQLEWLIQLEEDEVVEELDLDDSNGAAGGDADEDESSEE